MVYIWDAIHTRRYVFCVHHHKDRKKHFNFLLLLKGIRIVKREEPLSTED